MAINDPSLKSVDIVALLRQLETVTRNKVPEQVRLNLVLGASEMSIPTDGTLLRHVLESFLDNACKFTDKGSITFGFDVNGDEIYFFVKDTGIGLTGNESEDVFDGPTMGLPQSKSIIEGMGGEIGAESRGSGKGSTFWCTLPMGDSEPPSNPASGAPDHGWRAQDGPDHQPSHIHQPHSQGEQSQEQPQQTQQPQQQQQPQPGQQGQWGQPQQGQWGQPQQGQWGQGQQGQQGQWGQPQQGQWGQPQQGQWGQPQQGQQGQWGQPQQGQWGQPQQGQWGQPQQGQWGQPQQGQWGQPQQGQWGQPQQGQWGQPQQGQWGQPQQGQWGQPQQGQWGQPQQGQQGQWGQPQQGGWNQGQPQQPQGQPQQPQQPQGQPHGGAKRTILIAEDNESNYILFESILEGQFDLIHALNGQEAVDYARQSNPDLILMDINMPIMDGYEAVKNIRMFNGTVPIIAVTAYAFVTDKQRIFDNGFNGYVSKPISIQRLQRLITTHLGE